MLTMDQIHHIRQLFFEQDKNLTEIASETGLNWKTVKKYVDKEDFNSHPPVPVSEVIHESKLDPFKPTIDKWLADDKKLPRKQRHTAKRVFQRLEKEVAGFNCSYRLVAEYVAEKRKQLQLDKQVGYIPLIHHPGEAQVDFGTADFIENGRYCKGRKYLVLSFPYSNGAYLQYHLSIDLLALFFRDGGPVFPTGWPYFSDGVALKLRDDGLSRPIFVYIIFRHFSQCVVFGK